MTEHMILFFLVIAAIVATTVYVQRALQGRVRDARIYMVDMAYDACRQVTSINRQLCPVGQPCVPTNEPMVDCLAAANAFHDRFPYEYEPYYTSMASDVGRQKVDHRRMGQYFNGTAINPFFNREYAEQTALQSRGKQLPPSGAK